MTSMQSLSMNTTTVETNVSCGVFTVWIVNAHLFQDRSTVFITLLSLLIPPTAILNAIVLYVIWKRPFLQTTSNIFLCNLALSDVSISVFAIPIAIAYIAGNASGVSMDFLCARAVFFGVLGNIFGSLSFLTITAATVDRYLALRLHLRYTSVITKARVIYTCMGMWIISIALAMMFVMYATAYYVFIVNTCFSVCMVTIFYCYCKIYRILKHHHTQIQILMSGQPVEIRPNMNKYKSSVMSLVYVFLLYIVLYSPYTVGNIMMRNKNDLYTSMSTLLIGVFLVYLNSTLNPIVYCVRKTEIRNAMMETLHLKARVAATSV